METSSICTDSYKCLYRFLSRSLMNKNDGRGIINISDIFDVKTGNITEEGREMLIRKANGYISYVRGENPYTFPFRIYPDLFAPRIVASPFFMNRLRFKVHSSALVASEKWNFFSFIEREDFDMVEFELMQALIPSPSILQFGSLTDRHSRSGNCSSEPP